MYMCLYVYWYICKILCMCICGRMLLASFFSLSASWEVSKCNLWMYYACDSGYFRVNEFCTCTWECFPVFVQVSMNVSARERVCLCVCIHICWHINLYICLAVWQWGCFEETAKFEHQTETAHSRMKYSTSEVMGSCIGETTILSVLSSIF